MVSSWTIGNKEVASITIGNKEVQSIVRVSDSKVLYEKAPSYSISLVADKYTANTGETVTFTATVVDGNNQPVSGETVTFTDGTNTLGTATTNASGICSVSYSWNYTNTLNIKAIYDNVESNSVNIEIKQPLTLTFTGTSFNPNGLGAGLTGSNMVIDWGDGTTEALASDTRLPIHTYSTNKTYTIQIKGNITNIGGSCFSDFSTISSVVIPNSVTSMKSECFSYCSGLSSVVIPNSVTSMGSRCFYKCNLLVDYQLYWDYPPDGVYWSNSKMPNNTNTYFTIPYGSTANYIAQNYPSTKLIERSA